MRRALPTAPPPAMPHTMHDARGTRPPEPTDGPARTCAMAATPASSGGQQSHIPTTEAFSTKPGGVAPQQRAAADAATAARAEGQVVPSPGTNLTPGTPKRCHYCHQHFPSGNLLHKHLPCRVARPHLTASEDAPTMPSKRPHNSASTPSKRRRGPTSKQAAATVTAAVSAARATTAVVTSAARTVAAASAIAVRAAALSRQAPRPPHPPPPLAVARPATPLDLVSATVRDAISGRTSSARASSDPSPSPAHLRSIALFHAACVPCYLCGVKFLPPSHFSGRTHLCTPCRGVAKAHAALRGSDDKFPAPPFPPGSGHHGYGHQAQATSPGDGKEGRHERT
jgi:hypothetical protein